MSAKPFASFCFSTYKRPSYLKSTLESIRLQQFTDYEVIVSDNDENQSGRETVESFNDPRFKYFSNGENLGMKKSFNKSLERSSGEYIVMIADDDPVYPLMLQTLYDLKQEYPGYGMYLGGCDWYCTSHSVGKMYGFDVGTNSCLSNDHDINFKKEYTAEEFLKQLFSFGIFPHYLWSTAIVKREVLVNAGGVPEYGTPFLGDYAYMATIGSHSGCVVINTSLGCQTLHEENFGRKQNEQLVIAAKNFPPYIQSKASHLSNWSELDALIKKFTSLWIFSHMSFLHQYYKKAGGDKAGLKQAEKEVFKIDYIKPVQFKYFLKKNAGPLHDWLVKVKRAFRK